MPTKTLSEQPVYRSMGILPMSHRAILALLVAAFPEAKRPSGACPTISKDMTIHHRQIIETHLL